MVGGSVSGVESIRGYRGGCYAILSWAVTAREQEGGGYTFHA